MKSSKVSELDENFELSSFNDIKPYFDRFLESRISSTDDLKELILYMSGVEAYLSENLAWRYINYTRFTDNEEYSKAYVDYVSNIQPELAIVEHKTSLKVAESSHFAELTDEYNIYRKRVKLSVDLFREENVKLDTDQSILAKKYAAIQGQMAIEHNGEELTLQQATKLLKDPNRDLRKEVYNKVNLRRNEDKDQLDSLLEELIDLRQKEAANCGFSNYRDYKHKALGRFDYEVEDVLNFHASVKSEIVPLLEELDEQRRKRLGVDALKPYDLSANLYGDKPLSPFEKGEELIEKSIKCFNALDPFFGECLSTMNKEQLLDVESRQGKAPGGYNYPLDQKGYPFIFMNASGSMRDVTTMVHEGGHAVHSVLCKDIPINTLKHCPSEVAELASMSMELISMEHWDEFFDTEEELLRAKIEQLEGVLGVLPWIATIDKFQHWLYLNPEHTSEERDNEWVKIHDEFSSTKVDFAGYENFKRNMWQKQLHIYEVPFYYIEYGIAQLGAIALWRNYCEAPSKAIANYKEALKLGYTKPVPEIYKTAGIEFNFSASYVKELTMFVWDKYHNLVGEFERLTERT